MEYDGVPYRVIAPDAEVGEGTVVMPFCCIGSEVKIGKNCFIGNGCTVGRGAVIGDECELGSQTQIGAFVEIGARCTIDGQCNIGSFASAISNENESDFEKCRLVIENDVQIEPMCVIEYGASEATKTLVKTGCRLCVGVYVKAGAFIGEDCTLFPYCYVGNRARLCGNNKITASIIIGDGAVLETDVCGCNRFLFENYTIYKKNRRIDMTKRPPARMNEYNFSTKNTFFVTKRG